MEQPIGGIGNMTQTSAMADMTPTGLNEPAGFSDNDFKPSTSSESLDQTKSLVKQKEAELKEMQNQIESYNNMVKQLNSQREMAIKRLADMDSQLQELNRMLENERSQVEAKDKELSSKRSQLQTLKAEEDELRDKFNESKRVLSTTTENLANIQQNDTMVRSKLAELKQYSDNANAAMEEIEKAITIKDTIKLSALCDQMLPAPPQLSVNLSLANGTNLSKIPTQYGNRSNFNDPMFDSSANFDPFADEDPFEGDDPFKYEEPDLTLPEDDPFNPSSAAALGSSTSPFATTPNDPFAPAKKSDGF